MIVAVVRVSGAKFDVDSFVRDHGLTPDTLWRAGMPDAFGRFRSDSGFNLTIADAASRKILLNSITSWVQRNKSTLMALRNAGASGIVDIGLTVGTSDQFTASLELAPGDLALLGDIGLGLSVSAYPAAE